MGSAQNAGRCIELKSFDFRQKAMNNTDKTKPDQMS
jgi:hypothetical protein